MPFIRTPSMGFWDLKQEQNGPGWKNDSSIKWTLTELSTMWKTCGERLTKLLWKDKSVNIFIGEQMTFNLVHMTISFHRFGSVELKCIHTHIMRQKAGTWTNSSWTKEPNSARASQAEPSVCQCCLSLVVLLTGWWQETEMRLFIYRLILSSDLANRLLKLNNSRHNSHTLAHTTIKIIYTLT